MIDLHCHLLPALDDGARDIDMTVAMARIAMEEGITDIACTPHIYPGVYDNDATQIVAAVEKLQIALNVLHLPLQLHVGADTHLVAGLPDRLNRGEVPTLNHGRYLLLEPAHRLLTPHFQSSVLALMHHGYVPVMTHPERLDYIDQHYHIFEYLALNGVWMQITAGSLTGVFGTKAQYWAEKMMDDGLVHVIATDAHNTGKRAPRLNEALQLAISALGPEEAQRLVVERPRAVLNNLDPIDVTPIPALIGKINGRNIIYDKIKKLIS